MKRLTLLFCVLISSAWAFADAVEIDGIYYNLIIKAKEAEVVAGSYLGDVVIPEKVKYEDETYSVTSIGGSAFYGCNKLTSIEIPNSVTSIGDEAFRGCYGLTSIEIPNSVTSIDGSAFYDCSGLTSIEIPNSVTSISHSAFSHCSGLTSITIPNSVTSIGSFAFRSCSGLTSVEIPNSVTSISNDAFSGCYGLTSIEIPNSVTSIGSYAFSGCYGLTSIEIPNSVTTINSYAFAGCSGLTSIEIPNSVTSIGFDAFRGCTSLTFITIPNSVTSIGYDAFYGCSGLTSVTITNSVTSIGYEAFASCKELADVYCYAKTVPSTQDNAFMDSYIEYATLHVPVAAYDKYKNTVPWSGFGKIVTLESELPEPKKCEMPTISYESGQLKFDCATEDVEYVSEITDTDIKKYYESSISLTATYHISVYAMKTGYDNSEVATATLCWIDVEPKAEGITNSVSEVKAFPVLIQSSGGVITVQGIDDGQQVVVYSVNGMQEGMSVSHNSMATVPTNLQPGNIAIIKIGTKSVKFVVK